MTAAPAIGAALVEPTLARALDWVIPVEALGKGPLDAWVVHEDSVPVVTIAFAFRGGAAEDPVGQEGRANLAAAMLGEGTQDVTATALKDQLRDRGINLRFSAEREAITGEIAFLSTEFEAAAATLRDVLATPRLDASDFAREQVGIAISLRRQAANPRAQVGREFSRRFFAGSPWERPSEGTEEGVRALTAESVRAAFAQSMVRSRLVVAAAGALPDDALQRFLGVAFGSLPQGTPATPLGSPSPANLGAVGLDRPAPQVTATFGAPGFERSDPLWDAARLVVTVLGGGGFASRLMEEVREKRGLAYGIGAGLATAGTGSVIQGQVSTQPGRFGETLAVLREEWAKMGADGPTEEELEVAKAGNRSALPFQFTSTGGMAGLLLSAQLGGRDLAWLRSRAQAIEAVDLTMAKAASRRLFDPATLSVVALGPGLTERL